MSKRAVQIDADTDADTGLLHRATQVVSPNLVKVVFEDEAIA